MGLGLDKIKRDFAKHRAKAAMLGVLAIVMVVLIIKAVFDMNPKHAEADVSPVAAAGGDEIAPSAADSEEHLKHSKELWKTLRVSKGMDASVAFTFDPSYYPLDPKRQIQPEVENAAQTGAAAAPVLDVEADRRAHENAIHEQARALVVRSTVVGNGTPVAVINDRILSVGDRILGFEITAIRAREVEFKKEGVIWPVKMTDNPHAE